MAKNGFIKIHRQITEHELYKEPRKFSKLEAWLDLLLRANYELEDGIKPGSFITSYGELAKAWGWSKSTTWSFLKYLSQQNMITFQPNENGTDKRTVVSITKWGLYQGKKNAKRNENGTESEFLPITEKEEKNIYSELLSHWNQQKITVHRALTEDMKKAIDVTLKAYSQEEVMQAISRYSKIYHDKDYYFKYTWTLISFLKQKNALPDFMEEGQKWIAYKKATTKPELPKPEPDFDPYEIKRSWE